MWKRLAVTFAVLLVALLVALPAYKLGQASRETPARNVILFLGDAGGSPTLSAASIHACNEPRRLFIHGMAHRAGRNLVGLALGHRLRSRYDRDCYGTEDAQRRRGAVGGRRPRQDGRRVPDDHTGEEVLVAAEGPGAARMSGILSNTDMFHIMMAAYRWN